MKINQNENYLWEIEEEWKNGLKVYGIANKTRDPQSKKRFENEREKKNNKYFFKKESKSNRKRVQKNFRRKWTSERNKGTWHIPVNKEFHTGGWLTW